MRPLLLRLSLILLLSLLGLIWAYLQMTLAYAD